MKVVVLLDDLVVPAWVAAVIDHITASPHLELVRLVVSDGPSEHKKSRRSVLFRMFCFLDKKLFAGKTDAFERKRVSVNAATPVLKTRVTSKGIRNFFTESTLDEIRKDQPDVILRFGFGIVSGPILNLAPHGVWSLHHDDNDVIRGGPPGFWEWYYKHELSGATLQQLTDELDGGIVLDKTLTPTDKTSLFRNQNKVFWSGSDLLNHYLDTCALHPSGMIKSRHVSLFYSGILFRNPSWGKTLMSFAKLGVRAAGRAWKRLLGGEQWCLFVAPVKDGQLPSSLRRFQRLTPPSDRFWADPCVVTQDERQFVFLEEYIFSQRKGHIACLELDSQGRILNPPTPVLTAPHHLSYPFVFKHDGHYWMIPESGEHQTVILYKCISFPMKWEFHKTLMQGVEAFDSTVHFQDGKWWMFHTRRSFAGQSPHDQLYLYYTDDVIHGDWHSHPENPVVKHPDKARPAGRLFQIGDQWYRPSQICTPRYGYGISINKVVKLDEFEYREEQVEKILPHWAEDLCSTHTLSFNQQIVIVDGQISKSPL